ncbi:MAG: hypothetical protein ACR2QQ_14005 [Gammaproteobacteria bacterium]
MQDLPFWKAVLLTIGIVVVAVSLIYGASLVGLNDAWVAFLALVVWGASGMKMEQAPGIFIGAAYGLLLSLSVEALPDLYGDWAVIIPVVAIILTISCQITGKLPVLCNFSTFAFLTVGGADIILDQRLQLEYLPNLAAGAVLFWMIPWLILKLKPGGGEDTEATP